MFAVLAGLAKSQKFAKKLAEEHGEAYALVIASAAHYQACIPALPGDPKLDDTYRQQVQEHHHQLLHLQGIKHAAIALAEHAGLLRWSAEREVAHQVGALTQVIYLDRVDNAVVASKGG